MTPRFLRYGEVYVWRVRKPGAILGLPLIGRHVGYVGQTRNPKARDAEHLYGGGRYGRPPASWSDLEPRKWVLFKMRHCPQWLLNTVEVLAIRVLLPIYNVQWNKANPRRIKPDRARAMRRARDSRRGRFAINFAPSWGHATLLILLLLLVTMAGRIVQ